MQKNKLSILLALTLLVTGAIMTNNAASADTTTTVSSTSNSSSSSTFSSNSNNSSDASSVHADTTSLPPLNNMFWQESWHLVKLNSPIIVNAFTDFNNYKISSTQTTLNTGDVYYVDNSGTDNGWLFSKNPVTYVKNGTNIIVHQPSPVYISRDKHPQFNFTLMGQQPRTWPFKETHEYHFSSTEWQDAYVSPLYKHPFYLFNNTDFTQYQNNIEKIKDIIKLSGGNPITHEQKVLYQKLMSEQRAIQNRSIKIDDPTDHFLAQMNGNDLKVQFNGQIYYTFNQNLTPFNAYYYENGFRSAINPMQDPDKVVFKNFSYRSPIYETNGATWDSNGVTYQFNKGKWQVKEKQKYILNPIPLRGNWQSKNNSHISFSIHHSKISWQIKHSKNAPHRDYANQIYLVRYTKKCRTYTLDGLNHHPIKVKLINRHTIKFDHFGIFTKTQHK